MSTRPGKEAGLLVDLYELQPVAVRVLEVAGNPAWSELDRGVELLGTPADQALIGLVDVIDVEGQVRPP